MSSIKSDLVQELEFTAVARRREVDEHPGDGRYLRCADALLRAAEDVARLRDDDARLSRLADCWESCDDEGATLYLEEARTIISHHRFDELTVTTDGLLDRLVEVAERAARESLQRRSVDADG